MSRFYASIQGERGEATRRGLSSIRGHIRGWDSGIAVRTSDKDGKDSFAVSVTGGSNNSKHPNVDLTVTEGKTRLWVDGHLVWDSTDSNEGIPHA